jgi:hypothetical protein
MPLNRRRKHRATGTQRAGARAGLSVLGVIATAVTAVLIVTGSVLVPSGTALMGSGHWHPHRWKHRTAPAKLSLPGATRTVTATPSDPDPTETVTKTVTSDPSSSPSSNPSSPTTSPSPSTSAPPARVGGFGTGIYMGSYSATTAKASLGFVQDYTTTYLQAASLTTPNVPKLEAELSGGTSPILDLEFKTGPFTMAQIAAWGPEVQSYFKTFVTGLKTVTDYASALHNGTQVLFSFNHEAVVKINQGKYSFYKYGGGQPTIADSAAAWNQVMAYVAKAAPDAVRLYWYGGSGRNESTYANALQPGLIQAASFDPYRWSHDRSTATAQSLWGSMVSSLKAQSWMRAPDGSLKPWGLTEWGTDASFGDASNATFVTQALSYLQDQGASFAVYFDRKSGSNNFVITDGSQPKTLAAYTASAG